MLRISTIFATLSGACAHAGALFRRVEGCPCPGTRPLPPRSVSVLLMHLPSSALLWGACAQALPSFPLLWAACAQALALFHLVEESPCSARCPLLIHCGMPVLRHSPSSALLWGACPQTLALFRLVEGCLCSGSRPFLPHCVVPMLRQLPSSALLRDA